MIVIGLTSWPTITRLIRGEVLSIREREYIQAAKIGGISTLRIMFVHILPNVIGPIVVNATLSIGSAILAESALSFLGLGVQPPTPSWGNILTSGKDYMHIAWWLSIFPGLMIFFTVLSFNLLGEGLRDVFDPKT
jgi:peptide/nickel transport system permease protein